MQNAASRGVLTLCPFPSTESRTAMAEIRQSAIVGYSAEQMFSLVDDVARYPEFLPWCEKAELLAQTDDTLRARLSVAKGKLRYAFTTDNVRSRPNTIEMRLVDGPFKRLHGVWRFSDTPLGCKVSLELEFEFASRIIALSLSPVFKAITGSLVNSFKQRADALNGRV